ncbi:MAG: toll/interleukin-1 receptor domain-containing protein [Xanthobacteraceae bacterium]
MPNGRIFKAFFSYARHDAVTDPELIPAYTTALENRVNAKIVNAHFAIWCDKEGLRTGDRWDTRIETELRSADVLIVLLTPRWIESDYCRKEAGVWKAVGIWCGAISSNMKVSFQAARSIG